MELCPAPVIRSGYLNISDDFRFKKNYEICFWICGELFSNYIIIIFLIKSLECFKGVTRIYTFEM